MANSVLILVPCLLVGGTEMHALALAKALGGGGYRVTVCGYFESDPVMLAQLRSVGIVVRLLGLSRRAAGRNLGRMPRLAAALWRVISEEQPDFVHVQYMAPGLVPVMVARLASHAKVIVTVHVPGRHYGRRMWVPRRVVARLCDAFVCVSEAAERSFFGDSALFEAELLRCGRKHFAIPNAVDLAEVDQAISAPGFEELRKNLGIEGRPVVGMVSRLSREKGGHVLVAAMAEVVRQVPDAALLIVGDGAERKALEEQAARMGIAGHIRWTGRLPREQSYCHLSLMDVVAIPSAFEGFGLAAAEAMAFRKAVIASDIDGLREVVAHEETGVLVSAGDSGDLGEAIVDLLRDPSRRERMGRAGRLRVEGHFSMDLFAQRFLSLYRTLGATAAAAPAEADVRSAEATAL